MSPFRKSLWEALHIQSRDGAEKRLLAVAEVLQEFGLVARADKGWVHAQLRPVVSGVWERSLGETGTASLLLCEWLQSHLGLDIQGNGLLEDDSEAEAWFRRLAQEEER